MRDFFLAFFFAGTGGSVEDFFHEETARGSGGDARVADSRFTVGEQFLRRHFSDADGVKPADEPPHHFVKIPARFGRY